jgi:hypothetical protein
MTAYLWTGDGGDSSWTNAANWAPNTGFPSTTSDDVTINTAVTVNLTSTESIRTLALSGGATLDLSSNLTVTSGVTIGNSSILDIQSAGTLTNSSGFTFTGTTGVVNVEGTLAGNGGTSGTGTINFDGGTNSTALSGAGTITYNISNGSTVNFNVAPTAGSINFGSANGGTNTVIIPDNGSGATNSIPITGFGSGDQIQFSGAAASSVNYIKYTSNGNGTYQVTFQDVQSQYYTQTQLTLSDVKFASGITPVSGTYHLSGTGGNVYTFSDVCFLEGTAIATPAGEVAVEALQIGDLVTTIVGGEAVAKPVKWVGYRSVKPGDLAGEDAHPIRIKAGAFADNMPQRDLLVTPEHCILVDGGLTPARLLVNGRSIIVDTGISSFTYYHVELENHGILLAEGLATESYLDTGNRGRFANSKVTAFRFRMDQDTAHEAWQHAAAPLTVDPARVEPTWRTLNARAEQLGLAKVTAEPVLTTDPDLHIVTGNGAVIRPMRQHQDRFMFMVPAGAQNLTIASRTARPSETMPFIDDRRDLGVLVGEIALYEGRKKTLINGHLAAADLEGWYGLETAARRWTNGSAKLPLDLTKLRGQAAILEIQIVNAGPYPLAAEAARAAQAA